MRVNNYFRPKALIVARQAALFAPKLSVWDIPGAGRKDRRLGSRILGHKMVTTARA
jgi:hypothetical protein